MTVSVWLGSFGILAISGACNGSQKEQQPEEQRALFTQNSLISLKRNLIGAFVFPLGTGPQL